MTGIQAAIGLRQLDKLPEWQRRRQSNALRLAAALSDLPALHVPLPEPHLRHAWYRLYGFIDEARLQPGCSRRHLLERISARGVPCFVGSCSEIYLEAAFDATSWRPPERLENARKLGETAICFLVHPTLEERHIDAMAAVIAEEFARASA